MLTLFYQAKVAGVELDVVNGQLTFSATKGALTEQLKNELKSNKEQLVLWLEQKKAEENLPLQQQRSTSALVMSGSQKSLWLFDRIHGQSSQYNMPGHFSLHGEIDVQYLQQAFELIISRHDIFNYRFKESNGQPLIEREELPFLLSQRDLSKLSDVKQVDKIESLIEQQIEKPFDLANDLLLRVTLVRRSNTEHVLLFNMHHIISDGWSMGILVNELCEFYNALVGNTLPTLPAINHQFNDYALWQKQRLGGCYLNYLSLHWESQLKDAPLLHGISTDFARPAVKQHQGKIWRKQIPLYLTQKISQMARNYKLTEFVIWYTAFNVLVDLYGRENDIVVGTPLANREHAECQNLVGYFVNVLALRLNVNRSGSFVDLLAKAKKVVMDAFEHKDMPFELLIEQLQLSGNKSYTPLVQIMFAYQNLDIPTFNLGETLVKPLVQDSCQAKFDLQLEIEIKGEQNELKWEYDSNLFAEETIESMSLSLLNLLESVLDGPETPMSQLQLLPIKAPPEKHYHTVPASINMHFESVCRRFGDKTAIIADDIHIDYQTLDRRSNALANTLLLEGVLLEQPVALIISRSIEFIVAVIAVLKAGGCYVPIDPEYPLNRQQQIIDLSEASVVIATHEPNPKLTGIAQLILLEDFDFKCNTQRPIDRVCPNNLAYIMFTSGSTGIPKGVKITHDNVVTLVREQEYVEFNERRIFGHISNVAFDAATFEIFGALLNGGKLVVVDRETLITPHRFEQMIAEQGIDTLFITSALFSQLSDSKPSIFNRVKYTLIGGDVVNPTAVAKVLATRSRDKQTLLANAYGPTEATTFSTWYLIDADMVATGSSFPIGYALNGRSAVIVDNYHRPLPQGAVGELAIGGRGVARGYLVPTDKFIEIAGFGRCYLSGDLVRENKDGAIEYLGRTDNQVKVRGFRIELGEIAKAVSSIKWVDDCYVLLHTSDGGEKSLVCYTVLGIAWSHADRPIIAQRLLNELAVELPQQMLPHYIEFMTKLPLNANGKVDVKQLPSPVREHQMVVGEPPHSEAEKHLAVMWIKLLGGGQISRQTNFFQVGGHSLLASRMMALIRDEMGVEIPLSLIFASNNLAELASSIEQFHLDQISSGNNLDIDALLAEIDELDTETVSKMLQASMEGV